MNLSKIRDFDIVDDSINDRDIIRKIIESQEEEDSFFVFDVCDLVKKHKVWLKKIPRVIPHYAVKCNSSPLVIKTLAALNANFDCASLQEIVQVMEFGVTGDRIIFAHPVKFPSHIKFAKKVGVYRMTADNPNELQKIKNLFPEAKIVIRIRCDAEVAEINLGNKFGCNPDQEAIEMIHLTKNLGLNLHGFSFHVGSLCGEMTAYSRGIRICKKLVDYAKSIGCNDVRLIDIGGGFPGESNYDVDQFAGVINDALKDIDSTITVISEPGRYYVTSAFKLIAYLHGKKAIIDQDQRRYVYYINEGVFGSFKDELMGLETRFPISLNGTASNEEFLSTMWGQTADNLDCILKSVPLPEFEIGDWLIWKDMGAYTLSLASSSHGFNLASVRPVIRKSEWEALCSEEICTNKLTTGRGYTENPRKLTEEIENFKEIIKIQGC